MKLKRTRQIIKCHKRKTLVHSFIFMYSVYGMEWDAGMCIEFWIIFYASTKESKDCVKMTNKTINGGNSLDFIHFFQRKSLCFCMNARAFFHPLFLSYIGVHNVRSSFSYALEFICMHVIYLFRMLH